MCPRLKTAIGWLFTDLGAEMRALQAHGQDAPVAVRGLLEVDGAGESWLAWERKVWSNSTGTGKSPAQT